MRRATRWLLVVVACAAVVLVAGGGPRSAVRATAAPPDVYQVTAGSSAADTRSYQTGSPVDPEPAVNTAVPDTQVAADNGPRAQAHAAFVEPPQTAQAATGLNNVPVPYPTQVDALCANCAAPIVRDADGSVDQGYDGSRVSVSGGLAHVEAAVSAASAHASTARQTLGSLDQFSTLYNNLVLDVYQQVVDRPGSPLPPPPPPYDQPPPCQTAPAPVPTTTATVCPASLPLVSVLAQSGGSDSTSSVVTDSSGTAVDTIAVLTDTQLLDGLVSIHSIRTEVRGHGDGTAAGTAMSASNDVEGVCVAGDCSYTITAQGICSQNATVCSNDPVNQALRSQGFNLCRLGTARSKPGSTTATASAEGVLLEFHAVTTASGTSPDPTYYDSFGDQPCEAAPPQPHTNWPGGISSYTLLGESSAQLHTESFPCDTCTAVESPALDLGSPGEPGSPLSSTTTVTLPGQTLQGPVLTSPPVRVAVGGGPAVLSGIKDRRPLLLSVFGLLELVLLSNLTAMALARRGAR